MSQGPRRGGGDEPGLRRKNRNPHDESGPRGTDQGAEGWIRAHWDRSGPYGMDQGPGGGMGTSRVGR